MNPDWMLTVGLGLLVGLVFGYALQRGGFCMNTAFRELLFSRDGRLFKAWLMAVFVQLVVLAALDSRLAIDVAAPPVWWSAAAAGGYVFGAGMVLARGCTSGNYYRLGEGLIGAYVVVVMFLLGILITDVGLLSPVQQALRAQPLPVPPTLNGWLGVSRWWIVLVLGAVLVWWLWRVRPGNAFTGRWDWRETGLVIGLVAAVGWIASAMTDRYYGLSIIQPTQSWGRLFLLGDASALNWSAFVLLALPLGAAFGAWRTGMFQWRLPYPTRILQQMGGGVLMGVGGTIAGGCNIGHSLTGVAALSLLSLITTVFIMLGCWSAVWLLFHHLKVPR